MENGVYYYVYYKLSSNLSNTFSMPKFNKDVGTRDLCQKFFCEVWIIALIFYLILKWKKLEEFQEGGDTDPYRPCKIRISP